MARRAKITFTRAAEILGGRAERTDAMLLMVEAWTVTTLLAPGAEEGGTRMPWLWRGMRRRRKRRRTGGHFCLGDSFCDSFGLD